MERKQPNILLIMTDQLRGDCLGIAGHPDVKTPYLDTLAAQGTLFAHAYSACPSCIAARAALHTGMSQEHHRRVGYQAGIPWRYEHTMAGELGRAGYYTQCVGKMHVEPLRNYLGFHNVELHDGYLYTARRSGVPYRQSQFVADDYFYWLKQQKGADADVTASGIECNSWVARPFPYEEKYHPTNWVTDRCLDFLRRRDPDMPFFLMASYLRPHPPFDAPACYFDLYKDKKLSPPHVGAWESEEPLHRQGRIYDSLTGPEDPELIRQAQIGYYACITHLDHQIGRLLIALTEHEVRDNTVILFTSDHGEELCDHHHFRKALPYEGSVHIPLIVSGNPALTGLTPGSVCDRVTELRDIMPTLLDIVGAPVPDSVDGQSLLPLLRTSCRPRTAADGAASASGRMLSRPKSASAAQDPSVPFSAADSGNPAPGGGPLPQTDGASQTDGWRSWLHGEHTYGGLSNHYIVTETDKFCWFSQTGREQYFQLSSDPHELQDRIGDPDCQERIGYLRGLLIETLRKRPEGFSDGSRLIPGREYPAWLSEPV